MVKGIEYVPDTLIPRSVMGVTVYDAGFDDWPLCRVRYKGKSQMEAMRTALMKAEFKIIKVGEWFIYFEP